MLKKLHLVRSMIVILFLVALCSLGFAVGPDQLVVEVPKLSVSLNKDASGQVVFRGANLFGESGNPELPGQNLTVLLPPDADLKTVKVGLVETSFQTVGGQWNVRPVPPVTTAGGEKAIWPRSATIENGRNVAVYQNNQFFPAGNLGCSIPGQQRKWKLVDIQVFPYQYNPVSKVLRCLSKAKLAISYNCETKSATNVNDPVSENLRDGLRKKVINFEEVAPLYQPAVKAKADSAFNAPPGSTPVYVIITTNQIRSQSKILANFIAAKEEQGFEVELVTETDWKGGRGNAAAENIRSWLKNNYISHNIQYVLLIGDPKPDSGDVPMKMCVPYNGNDCPTDFYYADLTGNWDADGDQKFAEYEDYRKQGGPDCNFEVIVGRIPFYAESCIDDLDDILAKTINYGNASAADSNWRTKALIPIRPLDRVNLDDNTYLAGEEIVNQILKGIGNWSWYRIYQKNYGLNPAPDAFPCTYEAVCDAWKVNNFGLVTWFTHGSPTNAEYIMDSARAATLDNIRPVMTYQGSCNTACPERVDNLAYALLKNGAVSTIGATRNAYSIAESRCAGSASLFGMGYEYTRRLASEALSTGMALHNLKRDVLPRSDYFWMNYLDFNLYGDPSLGLYTHPEKPAFYLEMPSPIKEGEAAVKARVSIPIPASQNLTVRLGSSDTLLNVPSQVVIPAGQRVAEFNISALLDPGNENIKLVSVTANADGYRQGVNALKVLSKIKQYTISKILTQVKGTPFELNIAANDSDGKVVANYNQSLNLKLIDRLTGEESNAIAPNQINFVKGVFAGTLKVLLAGDYCLKIIDEADREWYSNDFSVINTANPLVDHFAFVDVSSVWKDAPFEITVTARDAANQIVKYNGPLALKIEDYYLKTEYNGLSINKIKLVDGSFTGRVTMMYPGIVRLKVVDEQERIFSSNYFTVAGCDLETTSLECGPAPPVARKPVTLTATIRNQGPEMVPYDHKLIFEFVEVGSGGQNLIAREELSLNRTIAAGESFTYTAQKTWIPDREGTHKLMLYLKMESMESADWDLNNQFLKEVTVASPPFDHFWIADLGAAQKVNQPIALKVTACDAENQVLTNFNKTVDLKLVDEQYNLEYTTIQPKQITFVNGVYSGEVKVSYSEVYRFKLCDDRGNAYYSNYFTVAGSDLAVTQMAFNPSAPIVYQPVAVVLALKNQGPGDVPAGSKINFKLVEVGSGGHNLIMQESLVLANALTTGGVIDYKLQTAWIPKWAGTFNLRLYIDLETLENKDWPSNNEFPVLIVVNPAK